VGLGLGGGNALNLRDLRDALADEVGDRFLRDHVNEPERGAPFIASIESLCKNIRAHVRAIFVYKYKVRILEELVQPSHGNPVGACQIAHGRITSRCHYPNHGLIIVVEDNLR